MRLGLKDVCMGGGMIEMVWYGLCLFNLEFAHLYETLDTRDEDLNGILFVCWTLDVRI